MCVGCGGAAYGDSAVPHEFVAPAPRTARIEEVPGPGARKRHTNRPKIGPM